MHHEHHSILFALGIKPFAAIPIWLVFNFIGFLFGYKPPHINPAWIDWFQIVSYGCGIAMILASALYKLYKYSKPFYDSWKRRKRFRKDKIMRSGIRKF